MTRPAKPPVRYAYAVCNAQGRVSNDHWMGTMLLLFKLRRHAQAHCKHDQHVERVRVSVVRKR